MMTDFKDLIRNNYFAVCEKISKAAKRGNRSASEIKLVVVTKAQPVEKVEAVILAGATLLGENYPEETVEKISLLRDKPNIQWHMIGHLQSRKIPLVINGFDAIHSIDSLGLAEKLSRKLVNVGKKMDVLIEVNVSGEESKFGFPGWREIDKPQLINVVKSIKGLPGINLIGLMTMPPYFDEIERSRPYFVKLRELRDYLQNEVGTSVHFDELSMGTSADYQVAIEEGATYVRIGQAIMGERIYK
jgi:pyridoxal phosphate enzyme (YggS family)